MGCLVASNSLPHLDIAKYRSCLVFKIFCKVFQILYHIEFYSICMEHYIDKKIINYTVYL